MGPEFGAAPVPCRTADGFLERTKPALASGGGPEDAGTFGTAARNVEAGRPAANRAVLRRQTAPEAPGCEDLAASLHRIAPPRACNQAPNWTQASCRNGHVVAESTRPDLDDGRRHDEPRWLQDPEVSPFRGGETEYAPAVTTGHGDCAEAPISVH